MSGRDARGVAMAPRRGAVGAAAIWGVLLCALCARALAAPEPVRVTLRGKPLALATPALDDGRELYLPLAALPRLGLTYTLERRDEIARVTLPGGRTLEVPLARPAAERMVPFSALAGPLALERRRQGDTCDLRPPAAPSSAREHVAPPKPTATSPPPEKAGVQPAQSIDPPPPAGASAPSGPKTGSAGAAQPEPARPEALPSRGAVVVVDLPDRLPVSAPADPAQAAVASPGVVLILADGRAFLGPPEPLASESRPAGRIVDVLFDAEDERHVQVRILADGPLQPRTEVLSDPTRIALDLPGAALPEGASEWIADHPLLAAVRSAPAPRPGVLRLELELRNLVAHHAAATADGALVNLRVPRGAGRSVQEAIVVLDPGHGGYQSGCNIGIGGGKRILEKDITLAVASLAAGILRKSGVRVHMTRTSDTAMTLPARPAVATERNADLFVSVHVDFTPIANAASGTTAYYHMQDADSRCLALSLAKRVSQAGGFPNRGAVSDRRLFASGLAVLRHSTVPAVLVELGYLSHSGDRRKLLQPEVQLALAQGIADGVRGYVEGVLPEQPLAQQTSEVP